MSRPLDRLEADGLAVALSYPARDTAERCREAAEALTSQGAVAHESSSAWLTSRTATAAALADLVSWMEAAEHGAPEERYTRLFDMKPVCTLDLGWHIFGDSYDRGALLAGLVTELKARSIPHRHQLPDYLPTLLQLLARIDDQEERAILLSGVVLPALEKVLAALAESTDPWSALLRTLPVLLRQEIPRGYVEIAPPRRSLEVLPC